MEPLQKTWECTGGVRQVPAMYVEYSRGNRRNRKPIETILYEAVNGELVPITSIWIRLRKVIRNFFRRNKCQMR